MKRIALVLIIVIVLLSACAPTSAEPIAENTPVVEDTAAPTEMPTEAPTATPLPTETPLPTATPVPTDTPEPTPTVEPPAQITQYLEDVQVTSVEAMDKLYRDHWFGDAEIDVIEGEMKIVLSDWKLIGLVKEDGFQAGEGVLLDFNYSEESEFGINFSYSRWGEEDFRSIGYAYGPQYGQSINVTQVQNFIGAATNWAVKADTWYTLLMAIDEDGDFRIAVWERGNPDSVPYTYRNSLGEQWDDKQWEFWMNGNNATMIWDNVSTITFSSFK